MDIVTKGYTGVSFPFRLNKKGGIMLSNTTPDKPDHINESIEQILGTQRYERFMEKWFFSATSEGVFKNMNTTLHNLLKFETVNTLKRLEPRIYLTEDSINIIEDDNVIYQEINYIILDYGTPQVFKKKVGEM